MNTPDPNPFETPEASGASGELESVSPAKVGRYGAILIGLSVIIAVVGIGAAVMLVPQAMERSKAARQEKNVALKAEHEKIARSSMVLGMTSAVCTFIALLSIVFPFKGRHDVATVLLCSCAASFLIVAVIFKPF